MDNLTHSLAGALLGQMGLKRLTGRAMPTLIIAANLPDIDALATLIGPSSLALRRGLTHGPIAMIVLPLILTTAMLAWNRWRPLRDGAPPVRPGALLSLALIGTLTHPALDWLNSYGIRLLEPFSSRWFAGDTLFIIDPWLWLALILGLWLSIRNERSGRENFGRSAIAAFAAICVYVLANGLITRHAEVLTERELAHRRITPELVVANPVPVEFWKRNMLWRDQASYGDGDYVVGRGAPALSRRGDVGLDHPRLVAVANRPDVAAFLFWSRMPIVVEQPDGMTYLTDQRFASGIARARFAVPLGR